MKHNTMDIKSSISPKEYGLLMHMTSLYQQLIEQKNFGATVLASVMSRPAIWAFIETPKFGNRELC
uniref:Uncharacterized protein n=1 Tax=Romanomermis culicivorax TaxID=13658 RepID=A0A915L240_ROMCU